MAVRPWDTTAGARCRRMKRRRKEHRKFLLSSLGARNTGERAPARADEFPRLYAHRLEPRIALSASSVVPTGDIFLDAGSGTNDGADDIFHIALVERDDQLAVRTQVNRAEPVEHRITSSEQIHVKGSEDIDRLLLDLQLDDLSSQDQTPGSSPFDGSTASSNVAGWDVSNVHYELADSEATITITIDHANDAALGQTIVIVLDRVESVTDAIATDQHHIDAFGADRIRLSGEADHIGRETWLSLYDGQEMVAPPPVASLSVTDKIAGSSSWNLVLTGSTDRLAGDLTIQGGNGTTIDVMGTVSSDRGAIRLSANQIDVVGTISAGAIDITADSSLGIGPEARLTVAHGAMELRASSIQLHGQLESTAYDPVTVDAGPTGSVQMDGTIRATGTDAGRKGGDVVLSGASIDLLGAAHIDVSHATGGGSISIGMPSVDALATTAATQTVFIGADARLTANALETGDGGRVRVGSEAGTQFRGRIEARGGRRSGEGGNVDVTSQGKLEFQGTIDLGAGEPSHNNPPRGTFTVDGDLAPGSSPGVLHVDGNLLLQAGGSLVVELNGTTPGNEYDQVLVEGESRVVDLAGASLTASLGFTPAVGTSFTIIDNVDPGSAIQNTFAGLAEGDTVFIDGLPFEITYSGGSDQNDVVLTYDTTPVVKGIEGDSTTAVQVVAGNMRVLINGQSILDAPLVDLSQIVISAQSGNDTIVLDGTGGSFSLPVVVQGGAGDDVLQIINPANTVLDTSIFYDGGAGFDALSLSGGGGPNFTETYSVGPTNDAGLVVTTDGSTTQQIQFVGLEPITTLVAGNLVVQATDAANVINVTDGSAGRIRISIDAFEPIEFANKTNVWIDASDGSASGDLGDTITLTHTVVPPSFSQLTVLGQDGGDTFNVPVAVSGYNVLHGSDGNDVFDIGASFNGELFGWGQTDRLQGAAIDDVTLTNSSSFGFWGTEADIVGGFFGIDEISAAGGTLTGRDTNSTWSLGATTSYSDGLRTLTFDGFATLQGGTADDLFVITATNALTLNSGDGDDTFDVQAPWDGSIDGQQGTDTLQGTLINDVLLSASTADGFSGTEPDIVGGFAGINTFIGAGGAITGRDVPSDWSLGGTTTYNDGGQTATISGFGLLQGGTDTDTFAVTAPVTVNVAGGAGDDVFQINQLLNGSVDGQAGDDLLDYSGSGVGVVANLINGTATNISGSVGGIEHFVGSSFNDLAAIDVPPAGVNRNLDGGPGTDQLIVDVTGHWVTDDGSGTYVFDTGGTATLQNWEPAVFTGGDVVVQGDGSDNTLVLWATAVDAGSYQLDGGPVVAFSGVQSFTFDAGDGDDRFEIHHPNAAIFNPVNGINYAAGTESSNGDELVLIGGFASSARFTYADAANGSIDGDGNPLDTAVLQYTDLESLQSSLAADTLSMVYGNGSDTIAISGSGVTDIQAVSDAGVPTLTLSPNTLLEVLGSAGDDYIQIDTLNSGFAADLTVDGGDGTDAAVLASNPSIGSGRLDIVRTENVTTMDTVAAANGITIDGATWIQLGGDVFTSGGDVSVTGGVVVVTVPNVLIDTDADDSADAGSVVLGNSVLTSDAPGNSLVIRTDATDLTGAAGQVTLGTVDASGGAEIDNLFITADGSTRGDIVLTGPVSVTGTLELSRADTVDILQDALAGQNLTVRDVTSLVRLGANVVIQAGMGDVLFDTGANPTQLVAGGTATLQSTGGSVVVSGPLIDGGTGGSVTINADRNVQLSDVDLGGNLAIQIDTGVDNIANLQVSGLVRAASVTIAGQGTDDTIQLDRDVVTTAGSVDISDAMIVSLSGNVTAAAGIQLQQITGSLDLVADNQLIAVAGDVDIASTVGTVDLQNAGGTYVISAASGNVTIAAPVRDNGMAASLYVGASDSLTVADVEIDAALIVEADTDDSGAAIASVGRLMADTINVSAGADGDDTIRFTGGDVTAANSLNVHDALTVELASAIYSADSQLDIVARVGQIVLTGAGGSAATLVAPGEIDIRLAPVRTANNPGADLIIQTGGGVDLQPIDLSGGAFVLELDTNSSGPATFTLPQTIDAGSIIIQGSADGDDTLVLPSTLNATTGPLTLSFFSQITAADLFSAGAMTLDGGQVNLNGTTYQSGDTIDVTGTTRVVNVGPVIIQGDNGVSFAGAIDGVANGQQSVEIRSLAGTVQLAADVGMIVPLASLVVEGDQVVIAGRVITTDDNGGTGQLFVHQTGAGTLDITTWMFSNGGPLEVRADEHLHIASTAILYSDDGDLQLTADRDGVATLGTLVIDPGAIIAASTGKLVVEADGNIQVAGLITNSTAADAISVTSVRGGITGGGTNVVMTARNGGVVINSFLGAGDAGPLLTDTRTLSATNDAPGSSGAVRITDADDLAVTQASASTGDIEIIADGDLTVTGVSTAAASSKAVLLVAADGAITDGGGAVDVSAVNGTATLVATEGIGTGDALETDVAGLIVRNTSQPGFGSGNLIGVLPVPGNVEIDQVTNTLLHVYEITQEGVGPIVLTANNDIALTGVSTPNSTNQAVTVTSVNGGILDGGDSLVDVVATRGGLVLDTLTGVGSQPGFGADPALETQIRWITADNTRPGADGDLVIHEVDNLVVMGMHTTGGGTASGSVQVTADRNLRLSTVGDGISATNGGDIILNAGRNLVINDTLAADDLRTFGQGQIVGSAGREVRANGVPIVRTSTGFITMPVPNEVQVVPLDLGGPGVNVDELGNASLLVFIRGGTNYQIIVDWNDFPSQGGPLSFPPTENFSPLGNGSGGSPPQFDQLVVHRFDHQYVEGNPTGNPSADIPFKVIVQYDFRGNGGTDNGIQFFSGGEPVIFVTPPEAHLTVPVQGIEGFTIEQVASDREPYIPPPPVVESPPEVKSPPTATTVSFEVGTPLIQVAKQQLRKVQLRLVSPTGDEITVDETENISILNSLEDLFQRLPDDRYRIYLVLEDGTQQLVLDVFLRGHKPVGPLEQAELNRSRPPALQETEGGTSKAATIPVTAPRADVPMDTPPVEDTEAEPVPISAAAVPSISSELDGVLDSGGGIEEQGLLPAWDLVALGGVTLFVAPMMERRIRAGRRGTDLRRHSDSHSISFKKGARWGRRVRRDRAGT